MAGGSDVWGTPAGDVAYDSNELTRAKTLETLSDVASAPGKRRLTEAQAAKFEEEVSQERRLSALATEMRLFTDGQPGAAAGKKPASMADQLDSLARAAMGSGLVTKAASLAKDSALVRQRDAAQYSSAVQAKLNEIKGVRENAELEGQLFGGVADEGSWVRANALFEFQTGRRSPYSGMAYSPELVQRLNQSSLSTKERADLEERKLVREATETYRTRRGNQIDEQNRLRKERVRQADEREARLAKAGGGRGASDPTSGTISQAKLLITKEFTDTISGSDAKEAAYQIAAEAKALKLANPALTIDMAIRQAFQAAKAAGDFTEDGGWGGTGIKKKTKFSGQGRTAAVPIVLPATPPEAKAALAKVPVGKYVRAPGGIVGIKTATGIRPLSPDNSRLDTEDDAIDDEEDDE